MIPQLKQLGLSEDEAAVYLGLLELGGGHVAQVAKRAGKHRATCYHTLGNLLRKGLVSKIEKRGSLFFSPEAPEKLVEIATGRLETARGLLPELLSLQNTLAKKPKIKFFEGAAGVESVLADSLQQSQSEILGFTNLTLLLELFPDLVRRYTRLRIERKIRTRFLAPFPEERCDPLRELKLKERDLEFLEILFVDAAQFPFQNEISISGTHVAITTLAKDETIGVIIESTSVAATLKAVFDLSWLGAINFTMR